MVARFPPQRGSEEKSEGCLEYFNSEKNRVSQDVSQMASVELIELSEERRGGVLLDHGEVEAIEIRVAVQFSVDVSS